MPRAPRREKAALLFNWISASTEEALILDWICFLIPGTLDLIHWTKYWGVHTGLIKPKCLNPGDSGALHLLYLKKEPLSHNDEITETTSTSQAILWTPTVKVKEDTPCYAPLLHWDIPACVFMYVWRATEQKTSHGTALRYYIQLLLHLLTFSTVTNSKTHKPIAMRYNGPIRSPPLSCESCLHHI